jgi:hypothetical protein
MITSHWVITPFGSPIKQALYKSHLHEKPTQTMGIPRPSSAILVIAFVAPLN